MVGVGKRIMKPVDNADRKTRHEWRGVGVPAIRVQGVTEAAVLILIAGQDAQDVLRVAIFKSVAPLGGYQRVRAAIDQAAKFVEIS